MRAYMKTLVLGVFSIGLLSVLGAGSVSAADLQVDPAGVGGAHTTIQSAITAASSGDTIYVAAGTYNESVYAKSGITIIGTNTADVRVVADNPAQVALGISSTTGIQDVTIRNITFEVGPSGVDTFAVQILNAQNILLENIIVDGNNVPNTGGINIGLSQHVTLNNVTAQNFTKNGFAIAVAHPAEFPDGVPTSDLTFNNVSALNNGWAGIAFYPDSVDVVGDITNIVFTGTTTIDGSMWGLQIGDTGNTATVTSLGSDSLVVENLVLLNTLDGGNYISNNSPAAVELGELSTINGVLVTELDLSGPGFVGAVQVAAEEEGTPASGTPVSPVELLADTGTNQLLLALVGVVGAVLAALMIRKKVAYK